MIGIRDPVVDLICYVTIKMKHLSREAISTNLVIEQPIQ